MDSGEWIPKVHPAPVVIPPATGPRYQYERIPWESVNAYGANGWRLTALPPIQEVKVTLGQPTPGDLLFIVEREIPEGERF